MFTKDQYQAAASNFREFFIQLKVDFLERDILIDQMALALISKSHLLVTGSPGNGKSDLINSVLSKIIDENTGRPPFFSHQFTEDTTLGDLIGPIDFKVLQESGLREHRTEEGMLANEHAFLDEVLDGRDAALRSILTVLNDRFFRDGKKIKEGKLECAFMATNTHVSEIKSGDRNSLFALLDRISFFSFIPKNLENQESLNKILVNKNSGKKFSYNLTIQDIDVLQHKVDNIFIPDEIIPAFTTLWENFYDEIEKSKINENYFFNTKENSIRNALKTFKLLKSIVVFKNIFLNKDTNYVSYEDLGTLKLIMTINGVQKGHLSTRISEEKNDSEKNQLKIMRLEHEAFDKAFDSIKNLFLPPITLPRKRKINLNLDNLVSVQDIISKIESLETYKNKNAITQEEFDKNNKILHDLLFNCIFNINIENNQISKIAEDFRFYKKKGIDISYFKKVARYKTIEYIENLTYSLIHYIDSAPDKIIEVLNNMTLNVEHISSWIKEIELSKKESSLEKFIDREKESLFILVDNWLLAINKQFFKSLSDQEINLSTFFDKISSSIESIKTIEDKLSKIKKIEILSNTVGKRINPILGKGIISSRFSSRGHFLEEVLQIIETFNKKDIKRSINKIDFLNICANYLSLNFNYNLPKVKNSDDFDRYNLMIQPMNNINSLLKIASKCFEEIKSSQDLNNEIFNLSKDIEFNKLIDIDLKNIEQRIIIMDEWWNIVKKQSRNDLITIFVSSGFNRLFAKGEFIKINESLMNFKYFHTSILSETQKSKVNELLIKVGSINEDCKNLINEELRSKAEENWNSI